MDSSADAGAILHDAEATDLPWRESGRIHAMPVGGIVALQRRLDDIGRLVSDWIWETDDTFRLTLVTERIAQTVGRLPLEVVGTALCDLFDNADGSATALVTSFRERRNFRDIAVTGRDRSGEARHFLISGVTVFDDVTGRFSGYRGTARDVTAERRAEAALRRHCDIMHAVASAAQTLLGAAGWRATLPEILAAVATAAAADGAAIVDASGAGGAEPAVVARWGAGDDATTIAAAIGHRRDVFETIVDAARTRVIVPVFAGETPWGSLIVSRGSDRPAWTEPEIGALTATAGLVGNAIHRFDCQRRHDESSALAATALASSPDAILIIRLRDGRILAVNAAFEAATGQSGDDVIGRPLAGIDLVAERRTVRRLTRDVLRTGCVADREMRFRSASGDPRIGSISAQMLEQAGDRCVLVVVRDITDRRSADETIHTLSEAIEQSPALVMITDPQGRIEYVNPQFTATTGLDAAALVGRPATALVGEAPAFAALTAAITRAEPWRGEVRLRRSDGSFITIDHRVSTLRTAEGTVGHVLIVGEDVSERRAIEARLLRNRRYDMLTDLPNRARFFELLPQVLGALPRDGGGALLLIDVDHFKLINDSLGPQAGDTVLREIGRRLSDWASTGTLVARVAGDEFALFIAREVGRDPIDAVPEVLALIARPMALGGEEVTIHASFGIACYPQDGADAITLLKNADVALSGAKACGGNTWRYFQPDMHARAEAQVRLGQDLRQALARDQFEIHFQPVVALADDRVIGAEALIRWRHPRYGQIAPGDFVGMAEDHGLIESIGEWVLAAACAEAKRWEDLGLGALKVAVNISGRQLQRGRVLASVYQSLSAADLPPTRLVIEITESAVLADVAEARETLDRLRTMGVGLSLDDFGTGYASLAYLRQLPFTTVKIDQSFIRDLHTDAGDQAIVDAILALGQRLGLSVVAEGIDDDAQLQWLRERRCDMVQGFLFSPPLPAAGFVAWARGGEASSSMATRACPSPGPGRKRQATRATMGR